MAHRHNAHHLLPDTHWLVLWLLEELCQALATANLCLGLGIKVTSKLSKACQLTELAEAKLEVTANTLERLSLGGTTNTRHRETSTNGWANTLVEKICLHKDLPVGDGNHVGGDVSGDIARLGLNDRQSSERTCPKLIT